MTTNNISNFPSSSGGITLSSVLTELEDWRAIRPYKTMKIPDAIWSKIFVLLKSENEAKVLRTLGLKPGQLKSKRDEMVDKKDDMKAAQKPIFDDVDFIAPVTKNIPNNQQEEAQDFGLTYKPAEAFVTNTSVVEFYRPDGMLMKVHICTQRFEELLRAFFKTNGEC